MGRHNQEGGGDTVRVYEVDSIGLKVALVVVKVLGSEVEVDGVASGSIRRMLVG